MLYDLDYAFYYPTVNNISLFTDPSGHGTNKSFSSAFITGLMRSDTFRARFVSRISKFWGSAFNPDYMLETFRETYDAISDDLPKNFDRWNVSARTHAQSLATFDAFVRARPAAFRGFVKSYFNLGAAELEALLPLPVTTSPPLVAVEGW
jgi:hypothetical protein